MQKRRTAAGSLESTCSAWRTCAAATASPDKRSKRSSHKSVGSGHASGEALQLKRKCWTQRQRRSTKVYPPAVPGGGRVMHTWQLKRGQSPCNGRESQGTEWQKGRWPERIQRKGYTSGAGNCKSGEGEERMVREQRRGFRCAGGPEPRRRPRAETLSAGYGARAHSQATDACERT
jgi:hypothetical protein